jgi:ATP-dependent HslUV protease subunit HslV
MAAARALLAHSRLSAKEIAAESLKIAAEIDLYTNDRVALEEIGT